MYQRRSRKFRRRPGGRNFQSRGNGNGQARLRAQLFPSEQPRNNFRTIHNPEKLYEKYTNLAKEALSAGDKILYENYLQHADHFNRLIVDKNKNKELNKNQNKKETVTSTEVSQTNNNLESNIPEKKQ